MTALLAEVQVGGELLVESLSSPRPKRTTVVSAIGTGKSAALRHAKQLIGANVVLLEATDDNLAPLALLNGLVAWLTAMGHRLPATDDADSDAWSDRVHRCDSALRDFDGECLVVLLSGVERLERLAAGGGTPGRHAGDLMSLLRRNVSRLGVSRTTGSSSVGGTVTIERHDLGDWLADEEAWGTLAPAASAVADRGVAWRRLPALTLRLLVALAHLDALPAAPPSTPLETGRMLAVEMATRRATRPTWAAWQLVAGPRGPLDDSALDVLLSDLPAGVRDEALLTRCLLFRHDGWHLHPSLREVVRNPPPAVERLMLPGDLVCEAGRRTFEHFRDEALRLQADGDPQAAAAARAAALDACAMAGDDALVERVDKELPDPYDHVGDRAADDPNRSRSAYEHARLVDEDDATALRGLADAEDRGGTDAAKVERLLCRALSLEPQDADSHVRLVGVLLAAGRPQAAGEAFDDAVRVLSGVLDEDDLARRLCVPVASVAIAAGDLPLASRAAVAVRGALGVDEAQELDRLVEGLVETLEYGEFVAAHRLGTRWWMAPELLSDFDVEHRPLSRWLAARVDAVEDEAATVHYADVVLPVAPDRRPQRAWTTLGLADLRRLSLDELPVPLPGAILEVGVYGDGRQHGSTVVRVVVGEPVRLPEPGLSLDRYVLQTA
jgi:hypothetical protein